MNTLHPVRKALFLGTLAAGAGFGIGCVLSAGSGSLTTDCGDPGSHSFVEGEECICEAGYEFCSSDPNDYECCPPDNACPDDNSFYSNGLCYCEPGYSWCNPSSPDDLSCCVGGDTDSTGGKGTMTTGTTGGTDSGGTGGQDCPMMTPPPSEACDESAEGLFYCTNLEEDGAACSQAFVCQGGQWVEDWSQGDAECQFDGSDIAVGCVFTQDEVIQYECLNGPGTPCTTEEVPGQCEGTTDIQYCQNGRLVQDSCVSVCQEIGDGTATFDYGECMADGDSANCFCCDIGDPGCDAGGSSSGGSTGP